MRTTSTLPDPTTPDGERTLRRLIDGQRLDGRNERAVLGEMKALLAAMERAAPVVVTAEFDHYGSGSASFVDAFVSLRPRPLPTRRGDSTTVNGVSLYLSRLGPWAVWGAGEIWGRMDAHGRIGYGRGFLHDRPASIHALPDGEPWADAWRALAPLIVSAGFELPDREAWLRRLGFDVAIPTALPTGGGGNRVLDAVFYWED